MAKKIKIWACMQVGKKVDCRVANPSLPHAIKALARAHNVPVTRFGLHGVKLRAPRAAVRAGARPGKSSKSATRTRGGRSKSRSAPKRGSGSRGGLNFRF